jgi:site-specific recombinase XerD
MRKNPNPPLWKGTPHLKQWQKCYDEWLQTRHEHSGSKATTDSYRVEARRFFSDPKKAPENYTREDVATFIRSPVRVVGQIMRPPSPCTQNRRLATLKSFYDFASTYSVPFHNSTRPIMSKPNPCNGLKAIKAGHKPKGLNEEELTRLFAAIPRDSIKGKRDFALFSAYFWSARRRCEVLALRWGSIYEVVFVENGVQRLGHMYRYSSKGHSRDVFTAEFHQEARDALIDYLKASGRYATMHADSPLFISTYYQAGPEKPLHYSEVNHILQKYAEVAGLQAGRKITTHYLRHTRAQLQRKYDKSPDALERIRKLLGHESLATTMIYLAGAEENPDDGAALLAQRLGKL